MGDPRRWLTRIYLPSSPQLKVLTPAISLCSLRRAAMRRSTSTLKTAKSRQFRTVSLDVTSKRSENHRKSTSFHAFEWNSLQDFKSTSDFLKPMILWHLKIHDKKWEPSKGLASEPKYLAHYSTSLCPSSWKWTQSTFASTALLPPKSFTTCQPSPFLFSNHLGGGKWYISPLWREFGNKKFKNMTTCCWDVVQLNWSHYRDWLSKWNSWTGSILQPH